MYKKCRYCNYRREKYKTVLKHQKKCIYKPTFLDKHYDNIISNEILKKEHPDIKYIASTKNITPSYTSYGNKLHIEIYTDEKLEFKQIEFDVIFIDQNHKMKGMQIEINNVEINKEHVEGSDKYTIELLESNLQNKDKINKLWNTIKYRFIDRLLILCRVLPLIIDLPDDIDTIIYSQWLLDNGFHFEYKFGDISLIFCNNYKDNFIDELNIKNLYIGTNIKYDISRRNIYNDEKKLESTEYLIKACNVCLCYTITQGTGPNEYIIEVKMNDIKINIEFARENAFWDKNEQNYIFDGINNFGKTKALKYRRKVNDEVIWYPTRSSYYEENIEKYIEINNIRAVLDIEKSKNVLNNVLNNLSYWNIYFNLKINLKL